MYLKWASGRTRKLERSTPLQQDPKQQEVKTSLRPRLTTELKNVNKNIGLTISDKQMLKHIGVTVSVKKVSKTYWFTVSVKDTC